MKTLLPALLLALGLAACSKSVDTATQGECAGTADCPDGLQCIDAACVEVQCTTSGDCGFESYCDLASYSCLDGCLEDSDCLAGDDCDEVARTCVSAGCTDTQLDCQIGEVCDRVAGQCVEDTRDHCSPCDVTSNNQNQCPGGECFFFDGGTCQNASDCDPGYVCSNVPGYGKICHADFCFMSCNVNVEESCPRGFECAEVSGTLSVCSADCVSYTQNGYL